MNKRQFPAVPLIACDPYFSVWSFSDKLYEDVPRHWTGFCHPITGSVTIDGEEYIFMGSKRHNPYMGTASMCDYRLLPNCMEQTGLTVTPLKTMYTFENEKILLSVSFMTPLFLDDLKLMSRPVSYMSYKIISKDDKEHELSVYIDVSSLLCVNEAENIVTASYIENGICFDSGNSDMLKRRGDDIRISWGRVCLAARDGEFGIVKDHIKRQGKLLNSIDEKNFKISETYPAMYCVQKFGNVKTADNFVCFAYDDVYSLKYYGKNIKAYYQKDGQTFEQALEQALSDFEKLDKKADEFDRELLKKAEAISEDYAKIVSISYRQAIAAHKLAWTGNKAVFVSKECFSNGCAATVDVTYPSIPLFLIYNADLVEYMLNPIFDLAEGEYWNLPFAPHDAGQYPLIYGQEYGRTEAGLNPDYQMPVEECGNMILCVAAVCKKKNSTYLAEKHFDVLNKWANYLKQFGFDPGNQLCTDDFAGHLAHNSNLAVKAIMALAAWGMILKSMGKADEFTEVAKEFARKWKDAAFENDHYRLAYDRENTWSIKYNLVWDRLFKLGIFDEDIFGTEIKYYKTKMNEYGLPLDVRNLYTKSDWQMWSTCLTNDKEYTEMIVSCMAKMLAETADRVPFTDCYFTHNARKKGFQNRTVQGGLFINLLDFS